MTNYATIEFENHDANNFQLEFSITPSTLKDAGKVLNDAGIVYDCMRKHSDTVEFDVYYDGDYDAMLAYEKQIKDILSALSVDVDVTRRGRITTWVVL